MTFASEVGPFSQKLRCPQMPYVNIKITKEGATAEQKALLMKGVTDLLVRVLDKNPATTFVVIDEVEKEDWGIAGVPVKEFRKKNDIKPTSTKETET